MNWYLKCLKQYADFNGRARRTEYWMFWLINTVVGFILGFIDGFLGLMLLSVIYSLAMIIPGLAVVVRRLHDVGKSGWMYFIVLIPIIGFIWMLILLFTDSQPGSNKWGENPKGIN